MHSRSTADCTCWKSVSSLSSAASVLFGRMSPTRRSSSRSSTLISVAAISTRDASSAGVEPPMIFSSRSVSL